ncbi:hypothetical protein BDR03DRAFT_901622 [Suillus americanus]|nr:hypothetical protein BDR03DRAFT_901622 [Suillus americanus]
MYDKPQATGLPTTSQDSCHCARTPGTPYDHVHSPYARSPYYTVRSSLYIFDMLVYLFLVFSILALLVTKADLYTRFTSLTPVTPTQRLRLSSPVLPSMRRHFQAESVRASNICFERRLYRHIKHFCGGSTARFAKGLWHHQPGW